MADELIGASVWEGELYQHLTSHVDNEQELLQEYQSAAEDSGSTAFQYLASLILEDEARHHQRFKDLASTLRTSAEFRTEKTAIPPLEGWGENPQRLVELTENLLRHERADQRALKQLEKELKDLKDTTLWQLLVRLMEADNEKHIEILNFVKDHAR